MYLSMAVPLPIIQTSKRVRINRVAATNIRRQLSLLNHPGIRIFNILRIRLQNNTGKQLIYTKA